jgi:hypothetical protein
MPRVILAHWHNGLAPGSELDVTDVELAALRRDGRIADVVDGPAGQDQVVAEPEPAEEPEPDTEAAGSAEPTKPSRRRR